MSCNQIFVQNRTYTHSSSSIHRDLRYPINPVEIYAFLDPLCEHSWSLEPYFKKLYLEYGDYITIRPVISRQLSVLTERTLNSLKEVWEKSNKENHFLIRESQQNDAIVLFPWVALAIKAAELQGKNKGRVFLRKIQEKYFLKKKNILCESVLIHCAEEANLDINEFRNDLFSSYAKNAYQCDMKVMKEMEVDSSPTLVLFNPTEHEQGIKMPGIYSYETYVQILKGMLGSDIVKRKKISLLNFLRHYRITTSDEVGIVFDWPITKAVQELKKLQIQQAIQKVSEDGQETYWEYIE